MIVSVAGKSGDTSKETSFGVMVYVAGKSGDPSTETSFGVTVIMQVNLLIHQQNHLLT